MNLYEIILNSADAAIDQQNKDGSLPAGHNGPYHDPETPVRNTSHWLITLLKAHEITGSPKYYDASEKAVQYLLSSAARPMQASFWHRKNPEKDFSNGLVGQAWTIEALVEANKHFDDLEVIKTAKEVFLLHPYNKRTGGWRVVNVDGSFRGLDRTFNHQLWFAAAGILLLSEGANEVKSSVIDFTKNLGNHLIQYRNGLIKHSSPHFLYEGVHEQFNKIVRYLRNNLNRLNYLKMKSIGYHGFNLYALALIKKELPEHSIWKREKVQQVLAYAKSDAFWNDIGDSKYGFPYNPPGFEVAFALQEFECGSDDLISAWISRQIKNCYDFDSGLMTLGNTEDKQTLAARIYEATRLKNYTLDL